MANPRAFAIPIVTGQKVTAGQFNGLDDGQYNALCRTGTTPLLANAEVQGGGHSLSLAFDDNAASAFELRLGIQDASLLSMGTGKFVTIADQWLFGGTGWPALGSRDVRRSQNSAALETTSTWAWNTVAGAYLQTTTDGELYMPLTNLIDGATMSDVRVRLKGQFSAGFSALPGTMPRLDVYKVSGATGAKTQLGATATDASPDVASFNAAHSVIRSAIGEVIDQSQGDSYFVRIRGAGGANYANNELLVLSVDVNFTVTSLRCLSAFGVHLAVSDEPLASFGEASIHPHSVGAAVDAERRHAAVRRQADGARHHAGASCLISCRNGPLEGAEVLFLLEERHLAGLVLVVDEALLADVGSLVLGG